MRITAFLDKQYTPTELDSMGWSGHTNSKGHLWLERNGSIPGGLAFAIMFPEGYRTGSENLDLSEVAVAANVRKESDDPESPSTGGLAELAKKVAVAVRSSNAPTRV